MSYFSDADIDQANRDRARTALIRDRTEAGAWHPIADPIDRTKAKELAVCPDCGSHYHYSTIPWQAGSCQRTSCRSYNAFQLKPCAICRQPHYRCSC